MTFKTVSRVFERIFACKVCGRKYENEDEARGCYEHHPWWERARAGVFVMGNWHWLAFFLIAAAFVWCLR